MQMLEKQITIQIPDGLHLRPAKELCQLAGRYESRILLRYRNKEFDAKSLLGVLSACVQYGDVITVVSSGADEEQALAALAKLLESDTV